MKVKLPYPTTIFGKTFIRSREIGFEFNNLAMFNFRENTGLVDSKKLTDWIEKYGHPRMINEIIYGAAQAYCMIHKTRENFVKSKLLQAVTLADEETQRKIIAAWELSINSGKDKKQEETEKKKKK